MSKLTYWHAENIENEGPAYDIRTSTKREAISEMADAADHYTKPVKVTVEYHGALDLMRMCLDEGGAHWEPRTT
jgi:hypothetical protein